MAAQQDFSTPEKLDKNVNGNTYVKFKNSVKDKLTWTKEDWAVKGMLNSPLNKLVNLMNYNGRHLAEVFNDKTLLITLFNETQEAHVNLQALLNVMKGLVPTKKFLGYYRPRNRKIIGLDFDSPETKEYVRDKLQYIGQDLVADMEWVNSSSIIDVRLHWLHYSITDAKIHIYLAKYMTISSIDRETEPFTSSSNIHTSLISLKAKLHPGVSADDVPHLTYFGGLQTLITIRGRVSLCLTCETLGHVAAKCPRPYCRVCRMNKPKRHTCVSQDTKASYARAVSSVHYSNKEQDYEDSVSEEEEEDMELQTCNDDKQSLVEIENINKSKEFPVLGSLPTKPMVTYDNPPPPPPPSSPPEEKGEQGAGGSLKSNDIVYKTQKVRKKNKKQEQSMPVSQNDDNKDDDSEQQNLLKKVKFETKDYATGIIQPMKNRSYAKNEMTTCNATSNNLFDALDDDSDLDPSNIFT